MRAGFVEHSLSDRLPRPTPDFVFADERVAVEADSRQWHRGRTAFDDDRERDAILATTGYGTMRFTDRQIENAPAVVAGALSAALTARAA